MAVIAHTSLGDLAGSEAGGVLSFKGVPYAAPPVGPLRWAPPATATPWSGLRDATVHGPAPLQGDRPTAKLLGILLPEQSEDCLALNIWTPGLEGRRPVMVWFPGGGWIIGSGTQPAYDGTLLAADGDVVVVTMSYRLGAFGFLRGVDVCGNAIPSTGNEGILDCIAALRWVQQEIAAFGGDPGNVTVFGESAGSVNAAALLASNRARGLFHKAILQSGPLTMLLPPAMANAQCERFLAACGVDSQGSATLRDRTAADILRAQDASIAPGSLLSYAPVADGDIIPGDPHAALAAGTAAGIPVLVGTNLDEMKLYGLLDPDASTLSEDQLLARIAPVAAAHGIGAEEAVARYRSARVARGEFATPSDLWFAIASDVTFRAGAMRLAALQSAHAQVYAYLFTKPSVAFDGRIGAAHACDVPYVFGTLRDPLMGHLVVDDAASRRLSSTMRAAWRAFARAGDPSTAELPWPAYDPRQRSTMVLHDRCHPVDAPLETERATWDAVAG